MNRPALLGVVTTMGLLASPAAFAAGFLTYPWTASATFDDGGRRFVAYINGKTDTILLQGSWKEIVHEARSMRDWPIQYWRQAAETLVGPAGCGISDVHALMKNGATWEATFVCPAGVDLRKLAKEQHEALMKGEPLHP